MTARVLTREEVTSKGRTALIRGASGIGKTTLVAELDKCFFIDFEKRTGPWTDRVYENGGAIVAAENLPEIDNLTPVLSGDNLESLAELGWPYDYRPTSMVIDGLADLIDVNINAIFASKTMLTRSNEDDVRRIYGVNFDSFKHLFRTLKSVGLVVAATILETDENLIQAPGQLRTRLPAAFDMSIRIGEFAESAQKSTRRIYTTNASTWDAKAPAGVPAIVDMGSTKTNDPEVDMVRAALVELGLRSEE